MKFLILSEWKFAPKKPHRDFLFPVWQFLFFRFKIADQIPCWQYISLIIKECLIRPIHFRKVLLSFIYFKDASVAQPEPGTGIHAGSQ